MGCNSLDAYWVKKLVIFCFSLSHFCDLFWNVTMITKICFIWQFCGQSINFAPVSHPKKMLGPPRGPKNLADSGWLWPTLDDFWWLWQTPAVSQNQLESAIVSQSQPYLARVSQSLSDSGWLWLTLADYGWLWLTLADSGWILMTLADSNWLWLTARVRQSHPELAKISQSQPQFFFGGGTSAKLILWPQNFQMKMLVTMVTFPNRSQKWLKIKQNMTSFWTQYASRLLQHMYST